MSDPRELKAPAMSPPTVDGQLPDSSRRHEDDLMNGLSMKQLQDWRPKEVDVPESLDELELEQVVTANSPVSLEDVLKSNEHVPEQFQDQLVLSEEDTLDNVVIKAGTHETGGPQKMYIVKEFNRNVKSGDEILLKPVGNLGGEWVDPEHVILAHRNGNPELGGSLTSQKFRLPYAARYGPGTEMEIMGQYLYNEPYFGAFGIHVVNVPNGALCKVMRGRLNALLDSGTHVIHQLDFHLSSPNFIDNLVQKSENYISHGTIHIIRVPVGKFLKIWIGTKPYLLPARPDKPYVFNSAFFRLGGNSYQNSLVDVNALYISHGPIHVARVPQGKFARVWFGNEARLLARSEPYRFNSPQFRLEGVEPEAKGEAGVREFRNCLVDIVESNYISHGNTHILRVPPGMFALVYIGNDAVILRDRSTPYVFQTPYFRLSKAINGGCFISRSEHYIEHGTLHIVQVPDGKIAKVWVGQSAKLLRARQRAYVYKSPRFTLVHESSSKVFPLYFEDANTRFFRHGNISWVMPRTGEVAVCYNGGRLEIVHPPKDGNPVVVDSPAFDVDPEFLSTTMRTLSFPSAEMQAKKAAEKAPPTEIPYGIVMTSDSLKVGVKLLVAYQISNPELALSKIRREDINRHIESVADADMSRAVQQCNSQQFLSSYKTTPTKDKGKHDDVAPNAPERRTIQDEVRDKLAEDLENYGISLIRMNFEEAKILDNNILNELQKQALSTASTNAQVSIMGQQYDIARQKAEQEAEVARITQLQANQTIVSRAQAEGEAVKAKALAEGEAIKATANAALLAAEMRAKTKLVEAEAEAKAIILKAEAEQKPEQLKAERWHKYPETIQVELARIQAQALAKATVIGSPAEVARLLIGTKYAGANGVSTFMDVSNLTNSSPKCS